MIVLEQQPHDLSEVAASHEGLAQYCVRAQVQSQAQLQAQGRVAGERARVGHQGPEVLVINPGAHAVDAGQCEGRASQEVVTGAAFSLEHVDQDERALCGCAVIGHCPIWP